MNNTSIARAAGILARCSNVVVFSGAGMSQESGIPTFRDALTGLWSEYNPGELATPDAFRTNPARVFAWYLSRLAMVRKAEPNAGHQALARMERVFDSVMVATQNVDGLHIRAGSTNVLELHGSLERFRCVDCGNIFDTDTLLALGDSRLRDQLLDPPLCELCSGYARPGVVWFGESLPRVETEKAWEAASSCDAMMVVGTSAQVYPAAELPLVAKQSGATVIEINPDPTPVSDLCSVVFRTPAAATLQALEAALTAQKVRP